MVRAAVCPAHGPPEAVRVQEHPVSAPGPGQVGVRVHAAAVNFPDVLIVAGTYQVSVAPPFVIGSEFAGVVDEIGSGVHGFAPGDRVAGTVLTGAFAERTVCAATALRPVVGTQDMVTAAASGVAYRTAYHCVRAAAQVTPGSELVVLGAGGGVGLASVQVAVALGARVTAVASSAEKLDAAARHGAAHGVNHRNGDLRTALRETLPEGADAIIDPVGGALSEPALRSLRPGGRFVTVGFASGSIPRIPLNLVLLKGVHVLGFQFRDIGPETLRRNDAELHALIADGRVTPYVGASYPLDGVVEALRHVAEGRAVGKVVIDLTRT